jgi:D-glycero-beta-D-manno-heptose-7-phosphate kinase
MNQARLEKLIRQFPQQNILVVGDVMLDHFLWGKVSRISPEAPVPVVEVQRESYFPGGAANVARNLRALGGRASILGVVGDDRAGEELCEILGQQGVETHGLVKDSNRPTTLKTRIVAHHQQIVRFDRERTEPLTPAWQSRLLENFEAQLDGVAAVIFEDYGKGVLTQHLLDTMHARAKHRRKITAADPNARHLLKFTGLTAITPNRSEAFAAAGLASTEPVEDVLRDEPLLRAGKKLLATWRPDNLLITLGEHGMCLFRRSQKPHHIPTVAQEVFDVSGAGDTAIATLVLALAGGANAVEAAEISNHAAGIVVGKVGTATCAPDELVASFARNRLR